MVVRGDDLQDVDGSAAVRSTTMGAEKIGDSYAQETNRVRKTTSRGKNSSQPMAEDGTWER